MSRGFKWALGVMGAFVLFLIIVGALVPTPSTTATNVRDASTSAGLSTSPAETSPSVKRTARGWTEIASWSGSGIKETETFRTSSREWRVRWRTSNEVFAGAGIFQIMVYDEDGSLVTMAANKQGTGNDVSYVCSSPGRHHLMLNSGNVDWDVAVEEVR